MSISWSDTDEIGYQLLEANEGVDPLSVSFTKLRDLVVALDEFEGDPKGCNEKTLEAVQMAWYDEWKVDNG